MMIALVGTCLTGCAESDAPDPDPVPSENGYLIADSVNTEIPGSADPVGRWSEVETEGRPAITYSWGGTPQLALTCDDRQGLNLELRGQVPMPPTEMIRLSTAGQTSLYAANPLSGHRLVRAAIPAGDPMIDSLIQGKPIDVGFGDDETIRAPASPLVPPFVIRCRSGQTP